MYNGDNVTVMGDVLHIVYVRVTDGSTSKGDDIG